MLQILRRNDYFAIGLFSLFGIVLWGAIQFLVPVKSGAVWGTPLAQFINSAISAVPGFWLGKTLHILLLLISALYFNSLVSNYQLLYRDTALPGFFYFFFQLSLFGQGELSASALAAPLVLIIFHILLDLFSQQGFPASQLFWMGVIIWICIMVYFDVLFLIPAFLPALFIVRPINGREMLLVVFGVLVAWYFSWAITRLGFGKSGLQGYFQLFYFSLSWEKLKISTLGIIFLSLILFVLMFSLLRQLRNYYKNNVRTRTIQQFLLLFLICSTLLCVLSGYPLHANFGFLAPPLAYFFAYFFIEKGKGIWKNILLLIIISLSLLGQMDGIARL